MPYIRISITKKVGVEKREELVRDTMDCIKSLPGKSPERLMVHIEDESVIYRGGAPAECAFVQLIFQKPLEVADQKVFIESMYDVLEKRFGLASNQVYFAMVDVDVWGSNGTLR